MTQVICNLLNNAVKFTKGGGDISIITQRKEEDSEVVVNIKDNGEGIDPDILPKLFTKFASKSDTGGTGLGLFISESIVEAHGGRIWAQNNPDSKGAKFSFSLPLANNNNKRYSNGNSSSSLPWHLLAYDLRYAKSNMVWYAIFWLTCIAAVLLLLG
ncbi:MAG: sensor histidine kinase [Nitrososphaeraceae archaeon]